MVRGWSEGRRRVFQGGGSGRAVGVGRDPRSRLACKSNLRSAAACAVPSTNSLDATALPSRAPPALTHRRGLVGMEGKAGGVGSVPGQPASDVREQPLQRGTCSCCWISPARRRPPCAVDRGRVARLGGPERRPSVATADWLARLGPEHADAAKEGRRKRVQAVRPASLEHDQLGQGRRTRSPGNGAQHSSRAICPPKDAAKCASPLAFSAL